MANPPCTCIGDVFSASCPLYIHRVTARQVSKSFRPGLYAAVEEALGTDLEEADITEEANAWTVGEITRGINMTLRLNVYAGSDERDRRQRHATRQFTQADTPEAARHFLALAMGYL